MELLIAAIVAIQVWQAVPRPVAGTYQTVAVGADLIRTDTRTGSVERCTVVGNTLLCKPITVEAK